MQCCWESGFRRFEKNLGLPFDRRELSRSIRNLFFGQYVVAFFVSIKIRNYLWLFNNAIVSTGYEAIVTSLMDCKMWNKVPTRPPHSAHISTQDILNIYTQLFNFNFNYQHTTRCLDSEEFVYKQLHLVRMHTSLYYLLCNSAPWWWSSTTVTCRCYKLRKYVSFVHFVGFH
jgi:hypothetical protein